MNNLQLTHIPVAKAEMLIRKSVAEVFEAFVNPEITQKFLGRGEEAAAFTSGRAPHPM